MIKIDVTIDLDTQNGKKEAHYKLDIKKEEFVVLFGASGAGKTTLLRLLAGLETPKSGRIEVFEEVWFDSKNGVNLPIQQRGVGFVFQDYALFPTMNIRSNILYGSKTKEQRQNIDDLLRFAHLENLAKSYPHQLSGGQKQRVALLRAIISNPQILLLDEPLSALDEQMRKRLQDELLSIVKKFQTTTLFVSHDKNETLKLADRVAIIEDGTITNTGTPSEIFDTVATGHIVQSDEDGTITIKIKPTNAYDIRKIEQIYISKEEKIWD